MHSRRKLACVILVNHAYQGAQPDPAVSARLRNNTHYLTSQTLVGQGTIGCGGRATEKMALSLFQSGGALISYFSNRSMMLRGEGTTVDAVGLVGRRFDRGQARTAGSCWLPRVWPRKQVTAVGGSTEEQGHSTGNVFQNGPWSVSTRCAVFSSNRRRLLCHGLLVGWTDLYAQLMCLFASCDWATPRRPRLIRPGSLAPVSSAFLLGIEASPVGRLGQECSCDS
jgi:hypothetical protein